MLKISLLFKKFTNFTGISNYKFTNFTILQISNLRALRIKNAKFSDYSFYINTNL